MDERSVDCLVLGHHDQDRKVSAKSVTMRAMTLCKNLSGYRELLLNTYLKIFSDCGFTNNLIKFEYNFVMLQCDVTMYCYSVMMHLHLKRLSLQL